MLGDIEGDTLGNLVGDMLGNRVGLLMLRGNTERVSASMEVNYESKLEVWACNDEPANVVATGNHYRRIIRDDGIYLIDSGSILRSTENAFHLTIDLSITINDLPHYQRRWVRSFDRQLL